MKLFEQLKAEIHKAPLGNSGIVVDVESLPSNWRNQINALTSYCVDGLRRRVRFAFNHTTGEFNIDKSSLTGFEDAEPEVVVPEVEVTPEPQVEPAPSPEVIEEKSGGFFDLDKFKLKPKDE